VKLLYHSEKSAEIVQHFEVEILGAKSNDNSLNSAVAIF
jgi:hypothetical protein